MSENDPNEFISIAVLDNDIEAQLLGSILSEQDIPHLMQSYHDTAFDGLFQVQKGWGSVYAPASYKADILEILDGIRSGTQDIMDYDENSEEP